MGKIKFIDLFCGIGDFQNQCELQLLANNEL